MKDETFLLLTFTIIHSLTHSLHLTNNKSLLFIKRQRSFSSIRTESHYVSISESLLGCLASPQQSIQPITWLICRVIPIFGESIWWIFPSFHTIKRQKSIKFCFHTYKFYFILLGYKHYASWMYGLE